MKKLIFPVSIYATKEKVWEILWNDASYRKWTAAFMEGSYAESDWKEGSRILFLTPGGDGMFSVIEKKVPNQQMIFLHLGEIKNGVEENKHWDNARESYFLEENNGITKLRVELDITPEFESYFSATFPKALQMVKELSE